MLCKAYEDNEGHVVFRNAFANGKVDKEKLQKIG